MSSTHPSREVDRTALIEKARAFLLSPTVRYENDAAKRRFLQEKGLTSEEIDVLIGELPPHPPPVPPRTYPQPPPSNLPVLLASFFRLITWTAGTSGVLLLGYYRFLLPRLTRSLGARHMLKRHQSELLGHLRGRIQELKATHEEVYNALAGPDEPIPKDIIGRTGLAVDSTGHPIHSFGVVAHCAFLGEPEQRLTLEELYICLLNHFPGLKRLGEREYKRFISHELSCSSSFDRTTEGDIEYWSLRRDMDSDSVLASTCLISSAKPLVNLRDAVSRGQRRPNAYGHTFKSLTDLTAFLSHETFALHGATTGYRYGFPGGHPLTPAEEDVRREIRALKGLVLNRRSFVPNNNQPTSVLVGSTS